MLTILNRKVIKNIPLTKEELEFIFEINRKIKGFGWVKDKRIAKIREEIVIENYEVAMKIVKMNGLNLQYASDKIKKDKEREEDERNEGDQDDSQRNDKDIFDKVQMKKDGDKRRNAYATKLKNDFIKKDLKQQCVELAKSYTVAKNNINELIS